jgi:hypothetical protein
MPPAPCCCTTVAIMAAGATQSGRWTPCGNVWSDCGKRVDGVDNFSTWQRSYPHPVRGMWITYSPSRHTVWKAWIAVHMLYTAIQRIRIASIHAYPQIHRPYYYGGFSLPFEREPDETVACGKRRGGATQRAVQHPAGSICSTSATSAHRPAAPPDTARLQRPIARRVTARRPECRPCPHHWAGDSGLRHTSNDA